MDHKDFRRIEIDNKINGLPNIGFFYYNKESELKFKLYMHNYGLIEAFSNLSKNVYCNVVDHFQEILENSDFSNYNYLISIAWGNDKNKMMDLFGYSGLDISNINKGNPEVASFVFKNGTLVEKLDHPRTCGDGLIILGNEELLRRASKSLEEYISSYINIPGLSFKDLVCD